MRSKKTEGFRKPSYCGRDKSLPYTGTSNHFVGEHLCVLPKVLVNPSGRHRGLPLRCRKLIFCRDWIYPLRKAGLWWANSKAPTIALDIYAVYILNETISFCIHSDSLVRPKVDGDWSRKALKSFSNDALTTAPSP